MRFIDAIQMQGDLEAQERSMKSTAAKYSKETGILRLWEELQRAGKRAVLVTRANLMIPHAEIAHILSRCCILHFSVAKER